MVQAFLAAHFSVVDRFLIHTERELNKGYADLYLEPLVAQYPDIGYGCVVEVKYLKRSERVDESVIADAMRGPGAACGLSGGRGVAAARALVTARRPGGGVRRLGAGRVRGDGAREPMIPPGAARTLPIHSILDYDRLGRRAVGHLPGLG